MNNHIPGYGGYIRTYQREHVTGKDIPAWKFEDISPDHHSIMHNSAWRSVYTDTLKAHPKDYIQPRDDGGARQRWEITNTTILSEKPGPGIYGTTYGTTISKQQQQQQQQQQSYQQRTQSAPSSQLSQSLAQPLLSGNHLSHTGIRIQTPPQPIIVKTTYPPDVATRINESMTRERETREREHAQREFETHGRQQASVLGQLSQVPHAQNLLRATWGTTSAYQADYGIRGMKPSERYPSTSTNPNDLSRRATTSHLFLGSSKGSIRIPNYAGHVPGSHVNTSHLRGTANVDQNHVILTSYRHDMPGYGGHAIGTTHGIQNVSNDRGPRTPRGKKQMDRGLQASLILDSMVI